MFAQALDRLIGTFSPRWGLERVAARATMDQIIGLTGGTGGYAAGKRNRLTRAESGNATKEHAIPEGQLAVMRGRAWTLFRDNPYARKIVRTLQSHVVGKGLRPSSCANKPDGTPDSAFRERAAQLWREMERGIDFRGAPGQGGVSFPEMQRQALAAVVISGEVLCQFREILPAEQQKRKIPVPLLLQLIDADRLADELTGADNGQAIYRGIELDADGRRVAYHLHDYPLGSLTPDVTQIRRIPAERILHLYVEDDIDQFRGASWFAPVILQMRDTGDYQYNELKAAAMSACVVLGYRRPTGAQRFGLQPSTDTDTTDDDGNPKSFIQPGMIVNLGADGKLEGFNPQRPGGNAESFISHLLRGAAAGMPGVKSSSVTMDYRNSSFSSERSADNDAWPELEIVQAWFASWFCQPVYERVIEAGILSGYFAGVITPAQYQARRANYVAAEWQGPVARSINPTDDAEAAALRIKAGQSSPQIEAAAVGRDWQAILRDLAEFYAAAKAAGLPEEVVNNILSVDAKDVIEPDKTAADKSASDKPSRSFPLREAIRERRENRRKREEMFAA